MNTKVKVGIAAAIVVALVGLILMDQRPGTKAPPAAEAPLSMPPTVSDSSGLVLANTQEPVESIVDRPADLTPPLEMAPRPADPLPEPETYTIQAGDTLALIAEKKYGDQQYHTLIERANPGVNPRALKVGVKLVIPARDTRPADAVTPQVEPDGNKSYTVQAGDTLARIAKRFYESEKPSILKAICAANPDLGDGNLLRIGSKLLMPKIDRTPAAAVVESPDPVANSGKKTYKVVSGDSLWKIAARHRGTRTTQDMMTAIQQANSDKLASTSATVRVGWTLVIPE
jgi:nucleoid-associated protein YgaU